MYLFISLLLFILFVLIHELGHFTAAKIFGAKVNEFSIGFGKKIFTRSKNGTEYSIRLFPAGGFCEIEGENDTGDNKDTKALCNLPVWKQIIIMVAGCFNNIILGIILYTVAIIMTQGIVSIPQIISLNLNFVVISFRVIFQSFYSIITGSPMVNEVSSFFGVVNFMSSVPNLSILFIIGAFISINLALFNLLPIPSLDGGHIFFILLNLIAKKVFHKNLSLDIENKITNSFFAIIIGISILLVLKDFYSFLF